jgi:hypothetical protein
MSTNHRDANATAHAEMQSAVASLASTVARHDEQLEAQGRILRTLTEQSAQHGVMLLEHAKLHTKHAEANVSARELARQAMQSTTDLGAEFRTSMQGLARHMAETERGRSEEIGELRKAMTSMATAQQQMAIQSVDSGRAMATLTSWYNHPIIKTIGAVIGAAIASYLAAKGH